MGARVDEAAAQLHRLVGGDAPRHPEDDALALEHGGARGAGLLGRLGVLGVVDLGLGIRPVAEDLVGLDLLEGDRQRLAGGRLDLRRHDGAEALGQLVVVRVDLPGPLGAQGDQRELRALGARSRRSSIGGFIIVSWREAMAVLFVRSGGTRRWYQRAPRTRESPTSPTLPPWTSGSQDDGPRWRPLRAGWASERPGRWWPTAWTWPSAGGTPTAWPAAVAELEAIGGGAVHGLVGRRQHGRRRRGLRRRGHARRSGGIDILVPNAGGPPAGGLRRHRPRPPTRPALELSLLSTVAMCQAAVPGHARAALGPGRRHHQRVGAPADPGPDPVQHRPGRASPASSRRSPSRWPPTASR